MSRYAMKHAADAPPRHSARLIVEPVNLNNPGDVFLQQEIERNRRSERWLVLKAMIALGVVVGLLIVREVFFV